MQFKSQTVELRSSHRLKPPVDAALLSRQSASVTSASSPQWDTQTALREKDHLEPRLSAVCPMPSGLRSTGLLTLTATVYMRQPIAPQRWQVIISLMLQLGFSLLRELYLSIHISRVRSANSGADTHWLQVQGLSTQLLPDDQNESPWQQDTELFAFGARDLTNFSWTKSTHGLIPQADVPHVSYHLGASDMWQRSTDLTKKKLTNTFSSWF